ncbi:hypothetical protein O181_064350 [Austropuccinia psidii MF-1]|uniref:Retrotransposon gag domain-containing protein n=1 Tax=Austropuccinia psidii MF-1 TaxID=1389203 RepID=A0A9Q3I321_9BASI|nr:hypothetical protein [Austropuccinia psidii MF-1]
MGQLTQAVAPRDTSRAPAFKTPSIKTLNSFDGTKAYKLRRFNQSCQLNFHNEPENFFADRKKLFTQLGDPNEVRKAEQELENLRMKESGQFFLYIADLRSLMSRIGDWGEGPIFMCIEEACHQDCWGNWLLTLENLIAFKNSWTSLWH